MSNIKIENLKHTAISIFLILEFNDWVKEKKN